MCYLLGKDNNLRPIDLGQITASSAGSIVEFDPPGTPKMRKKLQDGISPAKLIKYWPPALIEWSTKAVRDASTHRPSFPYASRNGGSRPFLTGLPSTATTGITEVVDLWSSLSASRPQERSQTESPSGGRTCSFRARRCKSRQSDLLGRFLRLRRTRANPAQPTYGKLGDE